ncbi:MAG: TerD family protein [Methylococcales bacterium]|nr:TerD family protein [Methylococcales bacterium]
MLTRQTLISGQNMVLNQHDLHVVLMPGQIPTGLSLDTSAFLLNDREQVDADTDFIFFNQPSGEGIELDGVQHKLTLHLERIRPAVQKIVLTATIFQGVSKHQSFKQLGSMTVLLKDFITGLEVAEFSLDTADCQETALIFAEFYRHHNLWKFRAMGAGFIGGLEPLAKHYGVEIGEGETAPPPAPPINLSKITLEKKGQSVSLEKKPSGLLGKIHINLNWNASPVKSAGFFSRPKAGIDLDLGCLFELMDGSIGGIQALGNAYGNFLSAPYIELDQDDRSGQSATGENLYINGDYWHLFRRILIFAFIYEGVPNWSHVDAKITLAAAGQADIEVKLDSHRNDQTMCAIALLENVDNQVVVTKLVDYFSGHQALDRAYGWGLRYAPGSK